MSKARTLLFVVVALVAAFMVWRLADDEPRHVSAVLPSAVSLFEGSDVKIMGVRVGEVTSVTPRGTSVLVEMDYDDDYSLPAGVQAVVVSPSVIGDRPGPCPTPRGTRPRRSGSANVVWPLPPNVVPSSENSAVFCAMDRICPAASV